MELFWKATAGVLIAVILGLSIGKQERDLAALLALCVCCMVGTILLCYLEPVLDLIRELETLSGLGNGMMATLLKAVGIALISELASLICADSGSSSLGKSLQMLGNAVILYLSVPLFQALLTLIREILGQL